MSWNIRGTEGRKVATHMTGLVDSGLWSGFLPKKNLLGYPDFEVTYIFYRIYGIYREY
jgi:hypothetical protein